MTKTEEIKKIYKKFRIGLGNTISFRRPVSKMVEGNISNEIIGWYKADWFIINNEVVQWKYWLHIDLWIIRLKFSWVYPFKVK